MWNPRIATELRKNEAMQAKQGERNENKVKQARKQTTDKTSLCRLHNQLDLFAFLPPGIKLQI